MGSAWNNWLNRWNRWRVIGAAIATVAFVWAVIASNTDIGPGPSWLFYALLAVSLCFGVIGVRESRNQRRR